MSHIDWVNVAIVAVPVLTMAGAVLLLTFRVGKLTGQTEARITAGDEDRSRIWEAIGRLTGRQDRHVEVMHRGAP